MGTKEIDEKKYLDEVQKKWEVKIRKLREVKDKLPKITLSFSKSSEQKV